MRGLGSGEPIGRCDEFRIERHVRIARELNRDTHTRHFYFLLAKVNKIRENRFPLNPFRPVLYYTKLLFLSNLDP